MLNTFFGTYFHQKYFFLASDVVEKVDSSHHCLQKLKKVEKNFKKNCFCAWCAQINFYFFISLFIYWSLQFSILGSLTPYITLYPIINGTCEKTPIWLSGTRNVPCVCTYIKFFQEVRQLCMNYTQHKYLMDWTIRKKDTHVKSQENLGAELWTLSLKKKEQKVFAKFLLFFNFLGPR